MTDNQIAIARRALACKARRWMPGMRALSVDPAGPSLRVLDIPPLGLQSLTAEPCGAVFGHAWLSGRDPDLDDPATKGCLLALVRKAWNDQEIGVTAMQGYDGDFGWICFAGDIEFHGDTEVEALVVALEAAP